jgi:hypothetical protein
VTQKNRAFTTLCSVSISKLIPSQKKPLLIGAGSKAFWGGEPAWLATGDRPMMYIIREPVCALVFDKDRPFSVGRLSGRVKRRRL